MIKSYFDIRAVILDMDGILVDTEPIHLESFRTYLNKFSIEPKESFLASLVGHSVENNIAVINETFFKQKPIPIQEGVRLREEIYINLISSSNLKAMDGVEQLIDNCMNTKILLGLASSSSKKQIDLILHKLTKTSEKRLDYLSLFNAVVSGDDVQRKKPAPDIYQKMIELLDISREKCLAVEDSYAGIQSAKAAGLKCIVLDNAFIKSGEMKYADQIIYSMHELNRIIAG